MDLCCYLVSVEFDIGHAQVDAFRAHSKLVQFRNDGSNIADEDRHGHCSCGVLTYAPIGFLDYYTLIDMCIACRLRASYVAMPLQESKSDA